MLDFFFGKDLRLQRDHLLDQRDKQAVILNTLQTEINTLTQELEAVRKELEIRTETCENAMREVERLTNELHTYEMVSVPLPKPAIRRKAPARKREV